MDWKCLSSLDKEKAGHYVRPAVYLHVIFDPNYPGVFWLYVGASINVASRGHDRFFVPPFQEILESDGGLLGEKGNTSLAREVEKIGSGHSFSLIWMHLGLCLGRTDISQWL